jgi:hypothetical protein
MRVRVQSDTPPALRPGQRQSTHFTGDWVGSKAFYIEMNKRLDTKQIEDLRRARNTIHPFVFLYHFLYSHYSQQSQSVALTFNS